MFTKEELSFLYRVLDQINLRGLDQKRMILVIMSKLTNYSSEVEQVEEEED